MLGFREADIPRLLGFFLISAATAAAALPLVSADKPEPEHSNLFTDHIPHIGLGFVAVGITAAVFFAIALHKICR